MTTPTGTSAGQAAREAAKAIFAESGTIKNSEVRAIIQAAIDAETAQLRADNDRLKAELDKLKAGC